MKNFRYDPPFVDEQGNKLVYGQLCRGFASTWDRDSIEDEMGRKSFDSSIAKYFLEHTARFGAPYIKVLRDHDELAAVLHYIEANDEGLYVEFWCLNTEVGRRFYVEIMTGAINQMSIGFIPMATHDYMDGDIEVRVIDDCELLEVSGVKWPCNYATSLGKSAEPTEEKNLEEVSTVDESPDETKEVEVLDIKAMCEKVCDDARKCMENDAEHSHEDHAAILKACSAMMELACKKQPAQNKSIEKVAEENSETETATANVADEKGMSEILNLLRENKAHRSTTLEALTGKKG